LANRPHSMNQPNSENSRVIQHLKSRLELQDRGVKIFEVYMAA
jgi:hypothetical protein